MTKAFEAFDTDKSGKLSAAEIGAALKKGGKKTLTDEDIESIVSKIDTDKDGEVSLAEFDAIFHLAPDAMPFGIQELVDVSATLLGGLGTVADLATTPLSMVANAIAPYALYLSRPRHVSSRIPTAQGTPQPPHRTPTRPIPRDPSPHPMGRLSHPPARSSVRSKRA